MTKHRVGTREEWLALEAEKELTRRSDELARRRQELPWTRGEKSLRRARGPQDARTALRPLLAAAGLPLHVRTRLGSGLQKLLVLGRQL